MNVHHQGMHTTVVLYVTTDVQGIYCGIVLTKKSEKGNVFVQMATYLL